MEHTKQRNSLPIWTPRHPKSGCIGYSTLYPTQGIGSALRTAYCIDAFAIHQTRSKCQQVCHKAFRLVETLFVQGKNLVPSRPGFGWRKINKPCQLITSLLGTRFLSWTNKVYTCRKALLADINHVVLQSGLPLVGINPTFGRSRMPL